MVLTDVILLQFIKEVFITVYRQNTAFSAVEIVTIQIDLPVAGGFLFYDKRVYKLKFVVWEYNFQFIIVIYFIVVLYG